MRQYIVTPEHNGVLTVTDAATDLEVTLEDAEYVLTSLDDGVRVTSTVSEDGVIVYEFKEVMHRQGAAEGRRPSPRPGEARRALKRHPSSTNPEKNQLTQRRGDAERKERGDSARGTAPSPVVLSPRLCVSA